MNRRIEFVDDNLFIDGKAKYCPFGNFKHCNMKCACMDIEITNGARRKPVSEWNGRPAEPPHCDRRCAINDYRCPDCVMEELGWYCSYYGTHRQIKVKTCRQIFIGETLQRDGYPDVFFKTLSSSERAAEYEKEDVLCQ